MNYSVQRAVSDGSMVLLPISIEYFDRSEITVIFDDGAGTYDWEWVGTSDTSIAFPTAIPNGVEVLVRRETDMSELRHSFTGGAAFTEQSIDEAFTQVLHIAQEAKEGAVLGEVFQDVDMHGYKLVNVGDGVNPTDGASVGQLLGAVQDITEQVDTAVSAASTASTAASTSSTNAASAASSKDVAVASANSAASSASSAATEAAASAAHAAAASIDRLAAETAADIASTSAAEAVGSAALAADFTEHYLGPKESPPSVDNEGDPLQVGQLYWDIYGNVMQVWSGTDWVAAYVSAGDYVTLAGVQTLTNKTLTSPTISASGASPALTVVQTGTGDCLTVYDEAADTTRFAITSSGNVGIGGTGADAKLRVHGGNVSLDQTTGHKVAFNASDAFTSSAGTNTARYGMTYNALGATFSVGLSGWGGLGFYTTDVLRMSIGSSGNIAMGAGSVPHSASVCRVGGMLSGGTDAQGILLDHTVYRTVTGIGRGILSSLSTEATSFTTNLAHFTAVQGSLGAGSTVTTQYGFVATGLNAATTNIGFYGAIQGGTGRFNFYAAGTAENYFEGKTTFNSTLQANSAILEKVYTVTDGAAVDLNPVDGTIQQWTLGASRSPTATYFANGQSMTLMISDGTAYTVTWPSVTWVGGSAPTLATTGWTIVELFKVGGVLYGANVGDVA